MKLFISYVREDKDRIAQLAKLLDEAGHETWFDHRLLPGQDWQLMLLRQISACDVVLFAISRRSFESEWCLWELERAKETGKPIIPVVLDRSIGIPLGFDHLQAADFSPQATSDEFVRLFGGLSHIQANYKPPVTPIAPQNPKGLPPRARHEMHRDHNSAHLNLDWNELRNSAGRNRTSSPFRTNNQGEKCSIIGIDFGTTSSVCAVVIDGAVRTIPNHLGDLLTPSAIYINADSSILVGAAAEKAALRDPYHAVLQVKRLFGTEAVLNAYGKSYRPPQLAAEILKYLIRNCEEYLGHRCRQVVMTVPGYFSEVQLDDLRHACDLAGLEVLRFIAEPTAASLACGVGLPTNLHAKDQRVAIFDLGGGTFDISISEVGDGVYEVLSIAGRSNLGGSDFDQVIVDYCIARFLRETGIDLAGNLHAEIRIREAAEAAKIELTTQEFTIVSVPYIFADASGLHDLAIPITRSQFVELSSDLFYRIKHCCEEAIEATIEDGREIDELILVGQSTRTPSIRALAEEVFNLKSSRRVETDLAVACGAAIQAGVLGGCIKDILLLDVVSHPLGIETGDGSFIYMIERNSSIPCAKEFRFRTTLDNQNAVCFSILEGSEEKKPLVLSKHYFEKISPGRAGESEIRIYLMVDANHQLHVGAIDLASGIRATFDVNSPIFLYPPSQGICGPLKFEGEVKDMQEWAYHSNPDRNHFSAL